MNADSAERYTLLMIPETGKPAMRFQFMKRRWQMWGSILGAAISILLAGNLAVFTYLYFVERGDVFKYLAFKFQNERLTGALRSEIPLLKDRLQEMAEQRQRIELLAMEIETITGYRDFNPRDFLTASGGLAEPAAVDTDAERALEDLMAETRAAYNEQNDIQSRLLKIQMFIRADQDRMRSTPLGWPVTGWICSTFGWRPNPWKKDQIDHHSGIDISAALGAPIRAVADGTVRLAGPSGGYGQLVVLSHEPPYETFYGHMSRVAALQSGRVSRGDVIGYAGSTGRSTGVHAHYEIRYNHRPVDPTPYVTILP